MKMLVVVFSIFGAFSSFAEEFATLDGAVNLSSRAKTSGCDLPQSDRKIKHLVVIFEGRSGYSDKVQQALSAIQAEGGKCLNVLKKHEDGSEEFQEMLTFKNGNSIPFASAEVEIHKLGNAPGSPVALKNIILKGMCKSAGQSFEDTHVLYFSHDQNLDKSKECLMNARKLAPNSDITLGGYSMGGSKAIAFGKMLHKEGIKVRRGITIDPVPHYLDTAILSMAAKLLIYQSDAIKNAYNNEPTPRSFEVEGIPWLNFYQEDDNRFGVRLGKPIGLQGNHVNGSTNKDQRIYITENQKEAHWRIYDNPRVREGIKKAFDFESDNGPGSINK